MRYPRLRRDEDNTFYHCYNRVAGNSGDRPFGRTEKETFVRMLKELAAYYVVEVVAYQAMSNHFHLILYAPCDCPSPEETCRRYEAYYGGKRMLNPNTERCAQVAAKLRDVSEFMGDLQQHFTTWFNRTRPVRRRGALWGGRYKNTIPFCRRLDRRVRYWVDGAAIGTELFVMDVMSRARPRVNMKKHRLSRAVDMARNPAQLCCYKQLRVIAC